MSGDNPGNEPQTGVVPGPNSHVTISAERRAPSAERRAPSAGDAVGRDSHERRTSAPQPNRDRLSRYAAGARRAVGAGIRVESAFYAFRQALKDIAADIRNVPANYKARRLLVDSLRRYARQHYERKRVAGRQEPTDPDGGRIF